MENLTETVYECTLPVEAHMICDLLARAGISARVDGEFLAGGGGELPLGSGIRVRVDPARAAEARSVIDEWQRAQPADTSPADTTPANAPRRSPWRTPLWFVGGALIGAILMFAALRLPVNNESVDLDDDGRVDETYYYSGQVLDRVDYDRNGDRRIDARWIHDLRGVAKRLETDDDFDGNFEWTSDAKHGWVERSQLDVDADGKPERVMNFRDGVMHVTEIYDPKHHRLVVRESYNHMHLVSREYDRDGDGVFERRVAFDALGEPLAATP